ncbi:MAG: AAA family ATPase, partial [Puniceicoccales bacterium]|nr:AAA family ATPase [Puniceicoccales bacterium]
MVLLSGARQVGKTTLAKAIAGEKATYVTLDDSQALQTAQADPQQFLCHNRELMIIDEIQKLPQLISAIKIAVDANNRRGQFILTGSADILSLPTTRESLAGRAGFVQLKPMSQGEIEGKKPRFLHYLRAREFPFLQSNSGRMEIITRAFRGGYPEAIQMPPHARRIWHEDYVRA